MYGAAPGPQQGRQMPRMLKTILVLALMAVPAWPQRPALACTVCLALPENSLADRLLSASVIVLAAPAPDDPFRYAPVGLLKGSWDEVADLPQIPFLVDSSTRNALRADPDRVVLMIYGPGSRDKAGRAFDQSWTKGFLMTPQRADFVAEVQAQGQGWRLDGSRSAERAAFFAAYLNSGDRLLRNTALIELHRAPYAAVRDLRDAAATPDLLRDLRSLNRVAYAPATIRLLGLQSDPAAAEAVRAVYPKAVATGGFNLREWALAGIEIDGDQALNTIQKALTASPLSPKDRRAIIAALVDGGDAMPEHRGKILDIFAGEIAHDQNTAGQIALATRDWGDDTLAPALRALLADPQIDPATAFAIRVALPTGQ